MKEIQCEGYISSGLYKDPLTSKKLTIEHSTCLSWNKEIIQQKLNKRREITNWSRVMKYSVKYIILFCETVERNVSCTNCHCHQHEHV